MTPDQLGESAHDTASNAAPLIASILASAKKNHPDPQAPLIIRRAESGAIPLQLLMTITKGVYEFRLFAETNNEMFFLGVLEREPEMAH